MRRETEWCAVALYHFEAKIISRGAGRSAVAAAAYASCTRIVNDYDGVTHDYTRKQGCLYSEIFLPPQAPPEWQERALLWNAVEAIEKAKDSRLARELIVALPVELGLPEWKLLLQGFIQQQCVNKGMCADCSIHDTDGHNPHAHILLTVRPLDEHGSWQAKTRKEYLCRRDDEERGFTAEEFAAAKLEGWEKQFPCRVGKEKRMLTLSEIEATPNCVRTGTSPKATRYGRQNPITERWNSETQLFLWRQTWQDAINAALVQNGRDERVDCRSHASRGMDEQPTLHEGYQARKIEQQGGIADRCEINRQIKLDNRLLRELKETLRKLSVAVKESIPKLAQTLEKLHGRLVIWQYQLIRNLTQQGEWGERHKYLKKMNGEMKSIHAAIKAKGKERKALLAERKACKPIQLLRIHQLDGQLATLTEEIEELRSHNTMLETRFDANARQLESAKQEAEQQLALLREQQATLDAHKQEALAQYAQGKAQLTDDEKAAVDAERERIHPNVERQTMQQLQELDGKHYDYELFQKAEKAICAELHEPYRKPEKSSVLDAMKEAREQAREECNVPLQAEKQHPSRRTTHERE